MPEMDLDLGPALEVLAADGVTVTLTELDGEVAHLAMSIVDADCAECLLPREMLEPVVLELLRTSRPTLQSVHIIDPREAEQ